MPLIMILNGPNLNMLGKREPEIYGHETLADIEKLCMQTAVKHHFEACFRQSNHEGELVTWIQEAACPVKYKKVDALIINAAAYTHTSIAIHDALKLLKCPIVEVHLSEPKAREDFRHFSYIEPFATAHFSGHGAQGYVMAIEALAGMIGPSKAI